MKSHFEVKCRSEELKVSFVSDGEISKRKGYVDGYARREGVCGAVAVRCATYAFVCCASEGVRLYISIDGRMHARGKRSRVQCTCFPLYTCRKTHSVGNRGHESMT